MKKDLSHVVKKQINTQYEMWGPNKKNFTEKFYGQSKLGFGAPTQRISLRNSPDRASWGSMVDKEFKMHFVLFFYLNKVIKFFRLTFNESRVVF
ncbi:hypothetical protein AZ907_07125 [Staphylococcus epidermidis]|nr:hypothetical protein AZ907_07125 [Staphylococcus epidermidis]